MSSYQDSNSEDAESNPEYWGRLGLTLKKLKKWDEASDAYRRATECDETNPVYWNNLGLALKKLEQWEEASEAFKRASECDPTNRLYWSNLGLALKKLEKWEEASEAYRQATRCDPTNRVYWSNLGLSLKKLGDLKGASEAKKRATGCDNKNPVYWNKLGLSLRKLEKWDEASKVFKRATEMEDTNPVYWNNLGNALNKLERWEEASEAFRRATECDETNPVYWNNLGNALKKLERWEDASEAYRRATECEPSIPVYWNNLGNALKKLERWEDASEAYRRATECEPSIPVYWNNLGNALKKLERWEDASEAYRRATECEPSIPVYWNNLGNTLKKLERWDEATEAYRRATECDETNPVYWNNLGNALKKLERWEDASEAYRRATKCDDTNPVYWSNLGLALFKLEKWGEASEAIQRATGYDPTDSELWNLLGNALFQLGERKGASEAFSMGFEQELSWGSLLSGLENLNYEDALQKVEESDAFMNLLGKTQLFPFEKENSHDRQKHSKECAEIGRELGDMLGAYLAEKPEEKLDQTALANIPDLLYIASLCHGIGDPPLGHAAESTIRGYIREYFSYEEIENDSELMELHYFDGKLVGVAKVLSNKLFGKSDLGKLVVSSMIKYPIYAENLFEILVPSTSDGILAQGRSQMDHPNPKKTIEEKETTLHHLKEVSKEYKSFFESCVKRENSGFFEENRKAVHEAFRFFRLTFNVFQGSGNPSPRLHFLRHPLSFLLEAADEISYLLSDFEDAANLRVKVDIGGGQQRMTMDFVSSLFERAGARGETIEEIKADMRRILIERAFAGFEEKYEAIMTKRFFGELIDFEGYFQELDEYHTGILNSREVKDLDMEGKLSIYDYLDRVRKGISDEKNLKDAVVKLSTMRDDDVPGIPWRKYLGKERKERKEELRKEREKRKKLKMRVKELEEMVGSLEETMRIFQSSLK